MPTETIEAPARIRPGHIQDRTLSIVAGATLGYRNLEGSPISFAYEDWGLTHKAEKWHPTFNGGSRWQAVCAYDEIHHQANPSGRDSCDMDIVSGGGNFPIAETQADAIKKLIAVKSWLAEKDRIIVESLIDGWSLAGAVRKACDEEFKFSVRARVRNALDALIQALESAKRSGWKFSMRIEP